LLLTATAATIHTACKVEGRADVEARKDLQNEANEIRRAGKQITTTRGTLMPRALARRLASPYHHS